MPWTCRWFVAQPRVPLIVPADDAKVLVAKYKAQNPGAVKLVMKDHC